MRTTVVWFLIVTIGSLAASCATFTLPAVIDNKVTDTRYEYTFAVPEGWQSYHQASVYVKRGFIKPQKNSWALVNRDRPGMITIANQFNQVGFSQLVSVSDEKYQESFKVFRSKGADYLADLDVKGVDNISVQFTDGELFRENLKITRERFKRFPDSYHPELLYKDQLRGRYSGYHIKGGTYWFVYPCRNENSCWTIFVLESVEEAYAENLRDLNRLLDSFMVGEKHQ